MMREQEIACFFMLIIRSMNVTRVYLGNKTVFEQTFFAFMLTCMTVSVRKLYYC